MRIDATVLIASAVIAASACPGAERPPDDAGPTIECTEGTAVELDFEVDFLDLDSGAVDATLDGVPPTDEWDVRVAYSADEDPHGFLVHNVDAEVVVTSAAASCFYEPPSSAADDLRPDFLEEPLATLSSVIVRTTEGRTFALGDAEDDVSDTSFAEHFRFRELAQP